MKKLMFAAAGAAMISGAYASNIPQAYDMTLTLKLTECDKGSKVVESVCGDDVLFYRKQVTKKFQGMFWGCECATIACNEYYTTAEEKGFIFWNTAKNSGAFHDADFAWNVLNVVGQKGQNIEGDWSLTLKNCEGDEAASLRGAGYGTANIYCSEDNQIKSMTGKVVGYYNIPNGTKEYGCKYCSEETECLVWDFCDCVAANADLAAVYGDWTLKFNSTVAKKLANGKYITEAYKFPAWVTEEMACIELNDDPVTPEPTAAEKAEKAYKEAVNVYTSAVEGKAITQAAFDQAYANSTTGQMNTAIWIDGTNESVKAWKELGTKRAALDTLLKDKNYQDIATNEIVMAAANKYWDAAQEYLRFSGAVAADGLSGEYITKRGAELKKIMDDAMLALENSLAKVATGDTVKANLKSALAACYTAAETYFNTAFKYVKLDGSDDPDFKTVADWTQKQLDAVTAEARTANSEQAKTLSAATTDMNTKKTICQALGGNCQ